jgi:penicillin amidase
MKSIKGLLYIVFISILAMSGLYLKISLGRQQSINEISLELKSNSIKNLNCELFDDSDGIAHIKTNSEIAGYACLGFIQARDRAAQMDYLRRLAYGQKAEIGGIKDLKSDIFVRTLGLKEKAEQLYAEMSITSQKFLSAFSTGINQSLLEQIKKKQVYEFEQMQIFPRPWVPSDTIALLLLQSLEQTKDNFLRKLDEEKWKLAFPKTAEQLFSKINLPWETYIIKSDDLWSQKNSPVNTAQQTPSSRNSVSHLNMDNYLELRETFFKEENWGSNNWVFAPEKSKSRNAWLANDPHLSLKTPPFWYWVNLETPEFNVIGANLPGAPIFPSGANLHASWGLTNSYLPVGNIFFVKKTEIETHTDVSITRPLIWFRFWKFRIPFFFKSIQRINNKWPILPIDLHPDYTLVYHWSSLDLEGKHLDAFFDLAKTNNAYDTDKILSQIRLNSWNFVFADTQGQIGYRATGLVQRFKQPPTFGIEQKPLSELLNILESKNYLSVEEIPNILNPSRKYIATANNRQWKSANYFLGSTSNSEFRAHRIENLISQKNKMFDLKDIQEIQCDVEAEDAKFLLPPLYEYLAKLQINSKETAALNVLKKWNFKTDLNCKECFLFRRWLSQIYENLGINVIAFYHILETPDLVDQNHFNKIIKGTLVQSYDEFLNLERQNKFWGNVHSNRFYHLWGDSFESQSTIGTPGDQETVSPGTADWNGELFDHKAGASQRLIVELTQPPSVYSQLAGENKNLHKPNLEDKNLAWHSWSHCQFKQRKFPMNWASVLSSKIQF